MVSRVTSGTLDAFLYLEILHSGWVSVYLELKYFR